MLKSIKKIENVASYKNYIKKDGLSNFKQYNLFYGWNGSGKSTIARILRALEVKNMNEFNDDSNFQIEHINNEDIEIINKNNLESFKGKIFVFNEEFIKKNIDFWI